MTKEKSLKKNVLLSLISNIMKLIFPLITFPYASRVLSPVGIGKVNFARSFVTYFTIIASLGITTYAIREASKVRDDRESLSKLSAELLIINLTSTFISYVLFAISILLIPRLRDYRLVLLVCSGTIFFTTIGIEWLFVAEEDYEYTTIRSILFQFLSLIFLFLLVRKPEDYVQYAALAVFSNVGSNLLNFFHSRKYITLFKFRRLEFKKHLRPVFTLFAMAIASEIYSVLDNTMLGFICGDFQVGLYSAASRINRLVVQLIVAVGSVMLPRLSYYVATKDTMDDFNQLVKDSLDVLLLFSIPSTIGLCVLSKSIVLLLSGSEFVNAIPIMRILNPIIITIGLSNFIGFQIFIPLNKEKNTLFSFIVGAITNFGFNLILIPRYQAIGAAIGSVVSETSVLLVQIILARKYIDVFFVVKRFLIYTINSIIMGIPLLFIEKKFDNNILIIICGIFLGGIIYLILLVLQKNSFIYKILKNPGVKIELKNRDKKDT